MKEQEQEQKNRIVGLDIVRCVAVLLIIGVHFFYNNGFYSQLQIGSVILFWDTIRWFTFSCVPLFLILTGYLKCQAKVSTSYYKGIVPILVTWLSVSFICIGYKIFYLHQSKTVFEWIVEIVNYKAADYSWYIELYIALFLLCPFLNMMFSWEQELRYHKALIITMIFVAFLPSLNLFIRIDGETYDFIPNYLVAIWPIAYYMIGAMIRKYQPRISKLLCFILIYTVCVFKALVTYMTAEGAGFTKGITGSYYDIFVMIITLCWFLMLYRMDIKIKWVQKVFAHISKRALHIYLLSSIADNLMNKWLLPYHYGRLEEYWWSFGVRIVGVFLLSLAMSEVVYPLTSGMSKGIVCLGWKKANKESQ